MKRDKSWIFPIALIVFIVLCLVLGELRKPSKPSPLYDINRDGAINSSDSKIIYDVFLDCYVATPDLIERCDVNCDGFVNDKDVSLVIEYVLTHDSKGNEYK